MLTFVTWCGVPVWAWSWRQAAQVAGTCRNMELLRASGFRDFGREFLEVELQQKPVASGNLQTCLRWKWWSCCTCSFVLHAVYCNVRCKLHCSAASQVQPPTISNPHFLTSKASSSSFQPWPDGHSPGQAAEKEVGESTRSARLLGRLIRSWHVLALQCTDDHTTRWLFVKFHKIWV